MPSIVTRGLALVSLCFASGAVASCRRVAYHGDQPVKERGDRTGRLTLAQRDALVGAFAAARYFTLDGPHHPSSPTSTASRGPSAGPAPKRSASACGAAGERRTCDGRFRSA